MSAPVAPLPWPLKADQQFLQTPAGRVSVYRAGPDDASNQDHTDKSRPNGHGPWTRPRHDKPPF